MTKNLNMLQMILLLMCTIATFSQVKVSILNMTYIKGKPISNCGTIDFDSNSSVRVQFAINLAKDASYIVGVSNLSIYSIGASGVRILRNNEIVQPVNFEEKY